MRYDEFSDKQLIASMWWMLPKYRDYDAIICDGSIRSGKTVSMTVGFILWAMTAFNGQRFAICGKTIESLRRNVTMPLQQEWLAGVCSMREKPAENLLIVTMKGRVNYFYLFGGRDESSYQLIQGITLAGALLDEVVLMPRSFVEQAMARCSVAGSRFWFNCNPGAPSHWFYKEWIQQARQKNALHLHFTMEDNASLDDRIKQRYSQLYTGVFFDRYILGLWRVAEGRVYDMFTREKHMAPTAERSYVEYWMSMDYGTLNPTAALLMGRATDGKWYAVREYYYSGRETGRQKTDEEYYSDLDAFVGGLPIRGIIIDPSAASMIACIRRHGKYHLRAADNSVLDGIRETATALNSGNLLICDSCTRTLEEFESYVWDTKAQEDRPVKSNDHAMDALRYFVKTVMRRPTVRVY